ncbi:hypothetical protein MB14_13095 [Roseivirga ehrenbergii]|uniref:Tetratricopeptide repeat protein n=2 Tax=Roseivirga ehrenbergii (strain DSM 102268 / JCM 13514 / KCTC 12282 / NCIMB 14502 / KMM 6017) TaxID=279360 RepID=A0A150XRZ4_ROSEK|nr:hypothetical protein MB14_13095 [Roseivirga ehrenbergii]
MSKEINLELLEKYIVGEITKEEVLSVNNEPLDPMELSKFIEDYLDVQSHLEAEGLKAELKEKHRDLVGRGSLSFSRIIAVAASVILIGVVSFFLIQRDSSGPKFDNYFDHFDQLITFRNLGETDFSKALEAYSDREYKEAYDLFDKSNDVNLNEALKFYFAMSALGSEKFEEAVNLFLSIGTDPSNEYYQQTRWYLGLAYWQKGDITLARESLLLIEEGDFEYKNAQKLLSAIND